MTKPTRGTIVRIMALAAILALAFFDSGSGETVVAVESTTTIAPTTTVITTTTTLAPIPVESVESVILWNGNVESGDTSQWRSVSISGEADVQVVEFPVHSGDYALRLGNYDVDGTHNAGARMNFQGPLGEDPRNLPDEAYYSAWFYIPFAFDGESNIFQFKQDRTTVDERSRVMVWKIALEWQGDGTYSMEFHTRIDQSTGEWRPGLPDKLGEVYPGIVPGKWFHIETFYMWGMDGAGRTTVWLDGAEVWDQDDMSTWANDLDYSHRPREWAVNHYLGDWQGSVNPADSWIFVDDLVVSTIRISDPTSAVP